MIDPQLLEGLKEYIPPLHDRIAAGYAKTQLDTVDQDLHEVLLSARGGFPEGLVYEGCERTSPQDTFRFLTTPRSTSVTRTQFDLSKTDVFLTKFKFSFEGRPVKDQYLFLPFVNDCSQMHVRDSLFYIKPVVADALMSVEGDYIFINVTSTRGNVYKKRHSILINGIGSINNIIHAMIHHELSKLHRSFKNKAVKLRILSVAHYLFAKYGVEETFRRFEDADVVIGADDITEKNYPRDAWTIFESTGQKPDGHPDKFYQSHSIRIAVPVSKVTPHVVSMMTALFFVLDNYPVNLTISDVKDPKWWLKTMGVIIFGTEMSEIDCYEKAKEHFQSMDGYFDSIAREEAISRQIFVSDMYQFIHYISQNFSRLIEQESRKGANCMYGKRLTVSRYILAEIYANIFRAINFSKKRSGSLTHADIEKMLGRAFRLRQVFEINSGLQYVTTIQSPSDCRMFKITCSVIPQQKTQPKSNDVSKAALRDPKRLLDISHVEVGAITHLPKSHPIGDAIVSPFAKTTSNGTLLPNPIFKDLIARTEHLIQLDY